MNVSRMTYYALVKINKTQFLCSVNLEKGSVYFKIYDLKNQCELKNGDNMRLVKYSYHFKHGDRV